MSGLGPSWTVASQAEKGKEWTRDIILRRVRATIVAVEKQ
jgi:hypothetical protein